MPTLYIKIIVLFILLLLSALFSCSETAFFSLTRTELHSLNSSKKSFAKKIINLLKRPRNTLITILLGNELVNVAFAIVVASVVYDLLGSVSWKVSTIVSICISVPMILIFGEILPKNIAVRHARILAPVLAYPIRFFFQFVFPVRVLLTKFADKMVVLFGGDPGQVGSMIMEEEFRQIVDLGYKEGVLEEGELELIHRIFELGNRTVSEIMTPVGKITQLSLERSVDEIVGEIRKAQFSRVPVYRSDPDNIIGVLHSRDVFRLYRSRQQGRMQELDEIVRPIHTVRKKTAIEDLLSEFQKLKVHLAIVLDDSRSVVGLVTMDDIFRLLFTQKLGRKSCK